MKTLASYTTDMCVCAINNLSCTVHRINASLLPTPQKRTELLAKKIEKKMKERGLNRLEFANLMNVQPSIITRWLSGTHNFTLSTLFDIEEKLHLSIIDLDTVVIKQSSIHLRLLVTSPTTTLEKAKDLLQSLDVLAVCKNSFDYLEKRNSDLDTERSSNDYSTFAFYGRKLISG